MNLKSNFLLLSIFLFWGCELEKSSNSIGENLVFVSNLKLNHIKDSEKKWQIVCKTSIINEKENILNCNEPEITIYKDKKISAIITGKTGVVNMLEKKSMIKSNVEIRSFSEDTKLYSNDLYFDSEKNRIWSYNGVKVIKNNIKTVAKGFIAKPDLSNIKFISHETQKI